MATRNIVVIKHHHHQVEHQPEEHHSPQHKHHPPSVVSVPSALVPSPSASTSSPRHHHHPHHYHQQRQQQQQQQSHQLRSSIVATKWQWHHVPSFGITATAATTTFWVCVAVCLLNPALPEVIYRVDPLALLAATLRTYQRAGCDSEQLSLSCPRGTSISIELAQYGRAGDLSDHSLCPPVSEEDLTTTGSSASASSSSSSIASSSNGNSNNDGVIHSGTEIEVKPPESCTVSGLQYALLQTVVDACQKKRHCKFAANPKTLSAGGDPCSGIRKFVEIAYKCRPYEFRSKVACENDNMPLVCNPYSRIAIYSASFGHTERESIQCGHGNTADNPEDTSKQTCLVSYATETVMQICHGRRRCSITADAGTFGRPCKNDVRMYLKVVYTCIPRKVLKDRYETAPESDEPQQSELDMDQDDLYDEDQFYKESEAIPPAPKLQGAIPNPAFPFDFNLGADIQQSSTGMPPLLSSRNDGSTLEDRQLQSSPSLSSTANVWLWLRKQKQQQQQQQQRRTQTTSFSSEYVSATNNYDDVTLEIPATESTTAIATDETRTTTRIADINSEDSVNGNDAATDAVTSAADVLTWKNFFYRRKCQMEDDWGPIGLECNDEDIVTERVEVVGFLVNWMQAYVHIRKNQEQFYLYLIISVAAGVLLCLTLVVGRLTLQRRRSTCRKNSSSSGSNNGKNCSDTGGGGGGGEKFHHQQQSATGETQLPNSFGDDISDIDADIDLTSPMPVPSLSSRNETYMTYAPTPNCTAYGTGGLQHQPSHSSATATTLLMPATHHGGLLMSSGQQHQQQHGNVKQMNSGMGMGCGGGGIGVGGPTSNINIGSRQSSTPPPGTLYTSMGVCSPTVSGTMTMVPHMLAPSALSAHHSGGVGPSYLSGTMMVPGHHHAHIGGTMRRTLIPTSMGMMMGGGGTASPPPSLTQQTNSGGGGGIPHPMTGIPSASSIYYDSTIPRNLNRGMSADSAAAAQYFYG